MSGAGFPRRLALGGDDAVDAHLEEVLDAGGGQHRLAVLARRDDRPPQPGLAHRLDEPHRPLVHLDTVSFDQVEHEVVLAVPEAVHGQRRRRVVGRALRERDPARRQERADAVLPQLAIDVVGVVGRDLEGAERLAGCLDASSRKASNICFQAAAWTFAVWVRTPSRSNRQAEIPSGRFRLALACCCPR